jgi:hypothetical protein
MPFIYNLINKQLNVIPELNIYPFFSYVILSDIVKDSFELIKDDEKNNNNENNEDDILIFKEQKYIFKKMGLIFVSIRIGLYNISPEYFPKLNELFTCKEYLGFIGGKNFQASYFIGNTDNYVLYIDPHYAQNAVEKVDNVNDIDSYNVKEIFQLQYKNLQTAMTLAFLFRNMKEFKELKNFFEDYCKTEHCCFSLQLDKFKLPDLENEKDKNDF